MRFHHVAYTTESIDKKAAELTALFGFRPVIGPMIDETQKVRAVFLDMGNGALMELLEPHGEKSPVLGHLKKGGGIYHTCYEVDDIDATLTRLRDAGDVFVLSDPVPAPAFGGRRIAFFLTSDRDLIELLEAEQK